MDYRTLRSALISKGEAIEDRRSHHVFFYVDIQGSTCRATKISHSARGQISNPILDAISQQMRLTNKELRHFVACTIDREKWIELWSQRA